MSRFAMLLVILCSVSFAVFAQETGVDVVLSAEIREQIYLSSRVDVKDHKRIVLEWSFNNFNSDRFFTIERSSNGKDFEVIAVIKGLKGQSLFEFTDELPPAINNYYRVKTVFSENQVIYSKIISRGVSDVTFCKFYPNPVEKMLIVRTESPVEIRIIDPLNKVRISKQLDIGLQLIDVNNLEKGLYIITLFQKESNRLITDKLIKN